MMTEIKKNVPIDEHAAVDAVDALSGDGAGRGRGRFLDVLRALALRLRGGGPSL